VAILFFSARCKPKELGLLEITALILKFELKLASISACKFVPLPEISTASLQ